MVYTKLELDVHDVLEELDLILQSLGGMKNLPFSAHKGIRETTRVHREECGRNCGGLSRQGFHGLGEVGGKLHGSVEGQDLH